MSLTNQKLVAPAGLYFDFFASFDENDRRTRLLVEMAGDERAKREIVLRDTRASTMTDLNAYRKANLRYCGDPKWG